MRKGWRWIGGLTAVLIALVLISELHGATTWRWPVPGNPGTGDLVYGRDTNSLTSLAASTKGRLLRMAASGLPAWTDDAPTCGLVTGAGTQRASTCDVLAGSDTAVRIKVKQHAAGGGVPSPNVMVTFADAFSAAPACVASLDIGTYAYYLYGVTPTTTTVTLKLGDGRDGTPSTAAYWPAHGIVNLVCAGV